MTAQTIPGVFTGSNFRQFLKFGLVGISNNIVDYLTWRLMMSKFHLDWLPAQLIAFTVSVSNGFVWNSMWTFRGMGSQKRYAQYFRFFAVNVISLGFGLLVMKAVLIVLNGQFAHAGSETLTHLNIAKVFAIVLGAVWNYTLNKRWTFK